MDIQLKRGILDVLVLSTLLREDSYGYKIIKDLSGTAEISESTLYPILRRLEGGKCLTVHTEEYGGRLRKYYKITPQGKKKIDEFLSEFGEIVKMTGFIERTRRNNP